MPMRCTIRYNPAARTDVDPHCGTVHAFASPDHQKHCRRQTLVFWHWLTFTEYEVSTQVSFYGSWLSGNAVR